MQAYDAVRFDPPAPVALVVVKSDRLGLVVHDVPMLLDTGADVSLLPISYVAQFVSRDAERNELEAFDGTKSTAPAITAELQLLGKTFRGQFLVADGWHGVLGRNVFQLQAICLTHRQIHRFKSRHPNTLFLINRQQVLRGFFQRKRDQNRTIIERDDGAGRALDNG
jgi:hypothetical protein